MISFLNLGIIVGCCFISFYLLRLGFKERSIIDYNSVKRNSIKNVETREDKVIHEKVDSDSTSSDHDTNSYTGISDFKKTFKSKSSLDNYIGGNESLVDILDCRPDNETKDRLQGTSSLKDILKDKISDDDTEYDEYEAIDDPTDLPETETPDILTDDEIFNCEIKPEIDHSVYDVLDEGKINTDHSSSTTVEDCITTNKHMDYYKIYLPDEKKNSFIEEELD